MRRADAVAGVAVVWLGAGPGLARADELKGTFHFGDVRFSVADGLAYQAEGKEPGKPMTVLVLSDFKIDRPAVMEAIETTSAVMGQIFLRQSGNAVFVTLGGAEGQCGVAAFLGGAQSVGLGEGFTAKTKTSTASRVTGTCATDAPGKMFDDAYDFSLVYDMPITAIPRPTALGAGGGEPGAAYLALVKAIQSSNFTVARKHLPEHQLPAAPPRASEVEDYFRGLALNYPRTAAVVGGLVKGVHARIEIQGVDNEGKKIKGPVGLTRTEGVWRVVDQGFMFTE